MNCLGNSTFEPTLIPALTKDPLFTSRAKRTGITDDTGDIENGIISRMPTIIPRSSMKAIESGIEVFFIQKARTCSCSKTKNMPSLSPSFDRNIKPSRCCSGVVANSTQNTTSSIARSNFPLSELQAKNEMNIQIKIILKYLSIRFFN